MSLPPHREKDAKVEGRDPPEVPAKGTMTAFDALTTRLLKVPISEVKEQQRIFEEAKLKPRGEGKLPNFREKKSDKSTKISSLKAANGEHS